MKSQRKVKRGESITTKKSEGRGEVCGEKKGRGRLEKHDLINERKMHKNRRGKKEQSKT